MKNREKLKQKWVKKLLLISTPPLFQAGELFFITDIDGEMLRTMFCLLSTFGKYDPRSSEDDSRHDRCDSK